MDRLHKTEAIVLKQVPTGEADRLLTLFTPDLGKVLALARGVRRPTSRMAGHLEPLCHTRVQLARGASGRWVVAGAEGFTLFPRLREDLERTARALSFAEAVDAFAPLDQPLPSLFSLLRETLERLEAGEGDRALLYGQLHLLARSGFRPELARCVECRGEIRPGGHFYALASGGVVCPSCRGKGASPLFPLSLNALKVLRYFLARPYGEVRSLRLPPPLVEEVRALLEASLRHALERDLKGLALVDRLKG